MRKDEICEEAALAYFQIPLIRLQETYKNGKIFKIEKSRCTIFSHIIRSNDDCHKTCLRSFVLHIQRKSSVSFVDRTHKLIIHIHENIFTRLHGTWCHANMINIITVPSRHFPCNNFNDSLS